jgi:hypothetical protein
MCYGHTLIDLIEDKDVKPPFEPDYYQRRAIDAYLLDLASLRRFAARFASASRQQSHTFKRHSKVYDECLAQWAFFGDCMVYAGFKATRIVQYVSSLCCSQWLLFRQCWVYADITDTTVTLTTYRIRGTSKPVEPIDTWSEGIKAVQAL